MISWIIIGILILIALVLVKARHIKHKTFIFIMLIFIVFFYVTASKIVGDQHLDLNSFGGITQAGKIYFSWLVHAGGNVKMLSGNAIKMDWLGNATSSAG